MFASDIEFAFIVLYDMHWSFVQDDYDKLGDHFGQKLGGAFATHVVEIQFIGLNYVISPTHARR